MQSKKQGSSIKNDLGENLGISEVEERFVNKFMRT